MHDDDDHDHDDYDDDDDDDDMHGMDCKGYCTDNALQFNFTELYVHLQVDQIYYI